MQELLNGIALHQLFETGYRSLKKNMNAVNDLNVFPVPDGDTGTNMVKTFGGGLRSVSADVEDADAYMQALSRGVLLSARGNSGIFFSQFVYGLSLGFAGKHTVCFRDFADAFSCAKEAAYKATVTPTEGTILTVIREAADFLQQHAAEYDTLRDGFAALVDCMAHTLNETPQLLPVLKEAGVVDSGGAGLLCFVEGMYAHLCGQTIEDTPDLEDIMSHASAGASSFGPDSVLEYGYCTEFILQLMNDRTDLAAFDLQQFIAPLEQMGDSLASVLSGSLVKIHVHTFTPEKVLGYARQYGEFVSVKIENMSVQHSETQAVKKREKVKYAIIPVASGDGIIDYFRSIGASAVIDGGQTNNPSVDDFLATFRSFDAEHIVVLPNNSNIILTAEQAAQTYTECPVHVIATKSIVEGYSALSMMDLWTDSVEQLIEDMSCGLSSVISASVTTAIRDANMDDMAVQKGQCIGLRGKHLVAVGTDRVQTALQTIETIMSQEDEQKEVIIVFYGADVSEEEAAALRTALETRYPCADIGLIDGKQDVYDFIISLE